MNTTNTNTNALNNSQQGDSTMSTTTSLSSVNTKDRMIYKKFISERIVPIVIHDVPEGFVFDENTKAAAIYRGINEKKYPRYNQGTDTIESLDEELERDKEILQYTNKFIFTELGALLLNRNDVYANIVHSAINQNKDNKTIIKYMNEIRKLDKKNDKPYYDWYIKEFNTARDLDDGYHTFLNRVLEFIEDDEFRILFINFENNLWDLIKKHKIKFTYHKYVEPDEVYENEFLCDFTEKDFVKYIQSKIFSANKRHNKRLYNVGLDEFIEIETEKASDKKLGHLKFLRSAFQKCRSNVKVETALITKRLKNPHYQSKKKTM